MNGNLRLTVIPLPKGFKILCQYQDEEVSWGPFRSLKEVSNRIVLALENLECTQSPRRGFISSIEVKK